MDERQFRTVFGETFEDVWRFARRRCSTAEDADDVAAETFAVAWRRRLELPEGDAARLWLFGTARLVLSNQRRTAGRQARLQGRVERMRMMPVQDPAAEVVERESDPLLAAMATLEPADRDLLIMRAWDGLAVTEIASLLDVTPNAISVRLTKARSRLSTALGQTDPAIPGQVRDDPRPRKEDAT